MNWNIKSWRSALYLRIGEKLFFVCDGSSRYQSAKNRRRKRGSAKRRRRLKNNKYGTSATRVPRQFTPHTCPRHFRYISRDINVYFCSRRLSAHQMHRRPNKQTNGGVSASGRHPCITYDCPPPELRTSLCVLTVTMEAWRLSKARPAPLNARMPLKRTFTKIMTRIFNLTLHDTTLRAKITNFTFSFDSYDKNVKAVNCQRRDLYF